MTTGYKGTRIAIQATFVFGAIVVLLPLLWLLSASLKTQVELTNNIWGPPRAIEWQNYVAAWTRGRISIYMLNSVIATATAIVLSVLTAATLSYALARFRFRLNRLLFVIIIAGTMIPIHSAVIPLYITAMKLKMQNNLFFLGVIYGAFRIPISVLILESFMITIPKELEECAVMDGASYYRIFGEVIFPLSRDGIVTVAILTALACWNELLVSMLMLSKPNIKTLPIGLLGFITEWTSEYTILCAGLIVACIPNLIFYALMQERIVKGMTVGAIKG
jgi:raffinose/stachyose/melibiose transport system permease protein